MPCVAPGPIAVFAKKAQAAGHKQLHYVEVWAIDGLNNRRSHGVPHSSPDCSLALKEASLGAGSQQMPVCWTTQKALAVGGFLGAPPARSV